ncbi:hypothetical protein U0070_022972 [Myodes glareolus]|uniref:Uncharacterized protein n=2 Tax=Myodes glareolus TaxID=447135 RepID=A0AAW0I8E5_MYOGA
MPMRARPGSRDALQLWAEARVGPRKDGCCSGVDGARERTLGFAPPRPHRTLTMRPVSRRTLDWIYSVLLLVIVLLSWGFVIYASTVAARRQLHKEFPDKFFEMNEPWQYSAQNTAATLGSFTPLRQKTGFFSSDETRKINSETERPVELHMMNRRQEHHRAEAALFLLLLSSSTVSVVSRPPLRRCLLEGVTRLTDSKTISGTLKRKTSPRMDDFSAWQGRGMQLKSKPWSTQ